uniref:Cytochrome P450 oxidase CYP82J12 n=1 Tax=Polygala tenuifolia TaxID=355332 RepID=A0A3G5ANN3_9FABA|nr:cytochrome P450 oxidase CYP82J12 [Polygala tenuifolia]
MAFLYYLTIATAGFVGFVLLLVKKWRMRCSHPKIDGMLVAPEPSGALPFIGHLHLLGNKVPLAKTLAAMADKYGSIFLIRLGMYPSLVVSNHEAVRECFTVNDKALGSRLTSSQGLYLGYNYASFGFASYGPLWRNMRKLAMFKILSARRLETLKHHYISEIDAFIGELFLFRKNNGPIKVVISEWFEKLSLNMITKTVAGKRYFNNFHDEGDTIAQKFGKVIREFMYLSGEFVASDFIPFLGWFNLQGQVLKSMKQISKDLDSLFGCWVEEHRLKQQKNESNEEQDFIDVMLAEIEDDFAFGFSRDTLIKATILNIILAGADTTSINLTWILSLLLNNRDALKHAQQELDVHVGRDRWVQSSDMKDLVYLQAIVKETLRLYPPGPLLVPHAATEDCTVCGYHLPKGTRLFVNAWKLHRDPRVWSEPDKFTPERFLTRHVGVDASGQHHEFVPFGSGRRACPGYSFATQVTHLTLARLLQGFEIDTPLSETVDLTEGVGMTMPKKTPLDIVLTPRLSCELYNV